MTPLFASAATKIRQADAWAALTHGVSTNVQHDFVMDLARRLDMKEGVALMSLMRNTYVVMAAIMRARPQAPEVILPRYSCPSFIHGIKASGIAHRYCDLDPTTLTITPELIDSVRTPESTAVLVPNLFGLSADMPALASYCKVNNLLLIDAADYTFGGTFAGRPLGSFGDFAILNFQEGKALPIGGGMALGRTSGGLHLNEQTKKNASSLIAFLRTLAYCILIRPYAYGLFSNTLNFFGVRKKRFSMEDTIRSTNKEFDFTVAKSDLWHGISSYQAALGQKLLATLESQRAQRWDNALTLEHALRDVSQIKLVPRHPLLGSCHYIRYPIMVIPSQRDALCAALIRQGFESSPMYVEHGMEIDPGAYPGASRICAELLTLPCHPLMAEHDLHRLGDAIRTFMKHS